MVTPQTNLRVNISAELADIKSGLATLRGDLKRVKTGGATSMDGLDAAGGKLKSFVSTARSSLVGLVGVLAGAGFALKGAIDRVDDIGETSKKVGIGTEALSELAYAAKLSDVEMGGLQTGLVRFNKQLLSNEASIQGFGIATRDAAGNFRATEEIIGDLADVFRDLPEGPQRSELALKLFGKAGADLIPMFLEGKQGLADMGAEARNLGVVVSEEAAASANEFNDNLTRLQTGMQGLVTQVASQLLPHLMSLVQVQSDGATAAGTMSEASTLLANAFKVVASGALILKNVFEGVLNVVFFLGSTATAVAKAFTVDLFGAFELLSNYWARLKDEGPIDALKAYRDEAEKFRDREISDFTDLPATIRASWDAMRAGLSEAGSDIGVGLAKLWEDVDAGAAQVTSRVAELEKQVAVSAERAAALKAALEAALAGNGNGNGGTQVQVDALRKSLEEAEAAAIKAQAEQDKLLQERGKRISEGLAEVQSELLRSSGDGAEVAFNEFRARYDQLLVDLRAAGNTEGEALLVKLLGIKKSQFALADFQDKASTAVAALRSETDYLASQVELGAISQVDAETQLQQARSKTLEQLVQIRDSAIAAYNAKPSAEALAAIRELDTEIGQITASQKQLNTEAKQQGTDALAGFFSDMATGAKDFSASFRDAVLGFVQGLARMAAQVVAKQAIFSLLKLFGNGTDIAALAGVGVGHGGGIAGNFSIRRERVSPLLFGAAPRYHAGGVAGLAPDEVPAILRRGEEVLTQTDPRHRGNGGRDKVGGQVTTPMVAIGDDAIANAMASLAGENVVLTIVRNNWEGLFRGGNLSA